MPKIVRDGRVLLRRSMRTGEVPIPGAGDDHTAWVGLDSGSSMIYQGELFANIVDRRLWINTFTGVTSGATSEGITELALFSSDIGYIPTDNQVPYLRSGKLAGTTGMTYDGSDLSVDSLIVTGLTIEDQLYVPNMDGSTKQHVLYWDITDGAVTYANVSGLTPAYVSTLAPSTAVPATLGGIVGGTTVGSLTGLTFTQLFDNLLFPTVDAYVATSNSANITGYNATTPVEVGTTYAPATTSTYTRGTFYYGPSGGLHPSPLTGVATGFTFYYTNVTLGTVTDATYVSAGPQGNTYASRAIALGSNTWTVSVSYAAMVDTYYNNKGIATSNLSSQRAAGTVIGTSTTVTGQNRAFWGINAGATITGGQVVALTSNILASGYARTISFADGSSQYLYYCYPSRFAGTPIFTYAGLPTTFLLQGTTISVINSSGYTENFTVWRSQYTQTGLGINIIVT